MSNKKSFETAAEIVPSERQLKWQDMEYYALISYSMPTFSLTEDGCAPPETFFPIDLDTDIWCETAKISMMKGLMVTAKYYDGFCVWQTDTTDYSVKKSKWLDGKGDILKSAQKSALESGLKFGIYYALRDRHEQTFHDSGLPFSEYVEKQVWELVNNYGPLFEFFIDDRSETPVNFDIDYGRIYSIIRKYQPDCAIAFRGPDARYLGNDQGVTRKSEWCVVPAGYGYSENGGRLLSVCGPKEGKWENDIGSRKSIKKETDFIWSPCEVYTKLRKHRFYIPDDDYSSKTKDKILDIYYRSVGNNSNLIFDLSPNKFGKFTDTEMQIFKSTGHEIHVVFGYNLAHDAQINPSTELNSMFKAENVLNDDNDSFWRPDDSDESPSLTVRFEKPELFNKIVIKEHIRSGQQVEQFTVYYDDGGKWKKYDEGTTVGHKKICSGKTVESQAVMVVFEKFRKTPQISYFQVN